MKKTAFTLIELIFAIVIIGVLASVAIPRFSGLTDNSKIAAELSTAASVQAAIEGCHGEWIINEGTFTCGASVTSAELDANNGYPTVSNLGSSANKPLDKILKNASNIDWYRDTNDRFYGPASKTSGGASNCKDNKPCIGRYWEYNATNGAFSLITP